MQNYYNQNKFEFILYINGNIIVQRYFSVREYNSDVERSIELHEVGRRGTQMIKKQMEDNTRKYLWSRYNPYEPVEEDVINIYDKEDIFEFEIKSTEKSLFREGFSGNVYPPKVRYAVDIRPIISTLISDIQNEFTLEEYTKITDVFC